MNFVSIHAKQQFPPIPLKNYVYVCGGGRLCARPHECSLPGSSVHGILQAGILEWVAISSSRGSPWLRDQTHVSYVSCIGRWILYKCHLGSPMYILDKEDCGWILVFFFFFFDSHWVSLVLYYGASPYNHQSFHPPINFLPTMCQSPLWALGLIMLQ